jgi:hypothetical protein
MTKGEVIFLWIFGTCAVILSIAMIVVGAIHASPLQRPAEESGEVIFLWIFGACAVILSIVMIVVGAINASPLQGPAEESGDITAHC